MSMHVPCSWKIRTNTSAEKTTKLGVMIDATPSYFVVVNLSDNAKVEVIPNETDNELVSVPYADLEAAFTSGDVQTIMRELCSNQGAAGTIATPTAGR